MSPTSRFAPVDIETTAPAVHATLEASRKQLGFVASPVARAARSPALLKHMLAGFGAFERSSLSHLEREVLAMTVAHRVRCHYCMALHSAALAAGTDGAALVEPLRSGTRLDDPRLEALRLLVIDLLETHGHLSEERLAALDAAGFTDENVLDAVLGVGVYVTSTLANIVTRAPLDAPFEPFRWTSEPAVR